MNEKTAAALTDAKALVSSIEPLFYNLIRTSQHHGLDTIQISTLRAREIAADLLVLKKRLQELQITETKAESTIDRHLDKMFGIN
jgi:hypothetical protein